MNATEAKALATSSKSSATTALVTAIDNAVQAAASKGNTKLCLKDLIADYSVEVTLEAYNQLRVLGYKINPVNNIMFW